MEKSLKDNINSQKIIINSISIALMLIINYIAAIMNINGGIVIIISIIIALQLIANKKININIRIVPIVGIVFLSFLISFFLVYDRSYTFDYLSKFVVFGIFPLYLGTRNFNKIIIYKTILFISFFTIPALHMIDYNSLLSGNKMGLTYALLPIYLISIMFFIENNYRFMAALVFISTSIVLIEISSRGVIVAIIFFLIGYFYITRFKGRNKKIIFLILSIITSTFIISRFWEILLKSQEILRSYNIRFYPLDKTILYQRQDKLLNARDIIWRNAIDGIKDNLLVGHGIGSFEDLFGTYTHNIFLQVLWEGGIFFFIPVVYLAFYVTLRIIKHENKDNSILFLFLLSISYISLLFSSMLWMNQGFWFLTGLVLTQKHIKNKGGNLLDLA